MANVIIRPSWFIPERRVTPEKAYRDRREFLRQLGVAGAGMITAPLLGCSQEKPAAPKAERAPSGKFPAPRNPKFSPQWKVTEAAAATGYNNFYEFTLTKTRVKDLVGRFNTSPWPVQISGLVENPMTLGADELMDLFGLEERVYRFRCVEAWAMIVPWTGFELRKLVEHVKPKPEAKFLRFETFNRPEEAPGMADSSYPFPYFEGLRMDEAMHPLTLLGTGIYGKPLPKQNGAPLRVIVPWKYGYKSIKSIVKIQFTDRQPKTFWETLLPQEYPFESNVNPNVPHPRWSQATERMIDSGDRVKTQLYNGYGKHVAGL